MPRACIANFYHKTAYYWVDILPGRIRICILVGNESRICLPASVTRVVRDGLIEALTRPERDTLWHKDQKAHIFWEWWTAENSDGFHNPVLARESLTRSVEESRKGIKLIDDAIEKKAASK